MAGARTAIPVTAKSVRQFARMTAIASSRMDPIPRGWKSRAILTLSAVRVVLQRHVAGRDAHRPVGGDDDQPAVPVDAAHAAVSQEAAGDVRDAHQALAQPGPVLVGGAKRLEAL